MEERRTGLKWVVRKPTCQSKLPGSAGHEEKGDADGTRLGFPDGITGEQGAEREGVREL